MAKYNRIKDLRKDFDKTQQELIELIGRLSDEGKAKLEKLLKIISEI